jgi:hypothetical protein
MGYLAADVLPMLSARARAAALIQINRRRTIAVPRRAARPNLPSDASQ